jgi:hypothetical protein
MMKNAKLAVAILALVLVYQSAKAGCNSFGSPNGASGFDQAELKDLAAAIATLMNYGILTTSADGLLVANETNNQEMASSGDAENAIAVLTNGGILGVALDGRLIVKVPSALLQLKMEGRVDCEEADSQAICR